MTYSGPSVPTDVYADECGIDITVAACPPRTSDPGNVTFVYWAMQVSFRNVSGSGNVGGGHFGLQWITESASNFGGINFGVYDDITGNYATFRASVPDYSAGSPWIDVGNINTSGFNWTVGHTYRLRCFKSPKQDWLNSQLNTGAGNGGTGSSPYAGVNQRANEVAWRLTVQDLTAQRPPMFFRDVLVYDCATTAGLVSPTIWTEPGQPSAFTAYSNDATFAAYDWDGYWRFPTAVVTYSTIANTDVSLSAGKLRHRSSVTRATTNNTALALPSSHWPSAPANVTPASSRDTAARVATPRPWW